MEMENELESDSGSGSAGSEACGPPTPLANLIRCSLYFSDANPKRREKFYE